MPGVFPNLSFTTSPVTSATYSEQGVTVPAVRVSRRKRHSCCRHILYWQFYKTKMRVIYSVHRVLSYFFSFNSFIFSLNTLYCLFSLNIFFLWAFVLSCHSDRCTRVRIGESWVNTFRISADKETLIITSVKCPVSYCMKSEPTSVYEINVSICCFVKVEDG